MMSWPDSMLAKDARGREAQLAQGSISWTADITHPPTTSTAISDLFIPLLFYSFIPKIYKYMVDLDHLPNQTAPSRQYIQQG